MGSRKESHKQNYPEGHSPFLHLRGFCFESTEERATQNSADKRIEIILVSSGLSSKRDVTPTGLRRRANLYMFIKEREIKGLPNALSNQALWICSLTFARSKVAKNMQWMAVL